MFAVRSRTIKHQALLIPFQYDISAMERRIRVHELLAQQLAMIQRVLEVNLEPLELLLCANIELRMLQCFHHLPTFGSQHK